MIEDDYFDYMNHYNEIECNWNMRKLKEEHYEEMSIDYYKNIFELDPSMHLNECSDCHLPVTMQCDGHMENGKAKIYLYVQCENCGKKMIDEDGRDQILLEKWNKENSL
jgi:RNase P subunit RPR2